MNMQRASREMFMTCSEVQNSGLMERMRANSALLAHAAPTSGLATDEIGQNAASDSLLLLVLTPKTTPVGALGGCDVVREFVHAFFPRSSARPHRRAFA
jgi:hypothetical protein